MQWLRNIVGSEFWYHVIIALLIVLLFGLFSRAARSLLKWLSGKIFSRTKTSLDDRIVGVALAHVRPLMLVIGFHIAMREIRKGTLSSDETIHQILEYGLAVFYVIAVLLIVKILLGIVRQIIDWYLDRMDETGHGALKETLGPLTGKIVSILVGFVGIIIILDHFGVSVGSLLVSLGVGSLAVALAAQDTLANMIAGFVILIDRPFRVGDRVELPSGQVADVLSIGLRSTRMVNFDSNMIILPNADLVKGRIINYASPFNQMRVVLKAQVAYGTDIQNVRTIMLELARAHPDILSDPAPEVQLTGLNELSGECTLFARAVDFAKAGPATNELREQLYQRFLNEGIQASLPQRVAYLQDGKS